MVRFRVARRYYLNTDSMRECRLRSTFLYVRVTRNPDNYRLKAASNMTTENILQGKFLLSNFMVSRLCFIFAVEICVKDLELLIENQLVKKTGNNSLCPTRTLYPGESNYWHINTNMVTVPSSLWSSYG